MPVPFLQVFLPQLYMKFLPVRATCSADLTLIDLVTLMIYGKDYKL